MRTPLPEHIKQKMHEYRISHGLLPLPQEYIDYQEQLAFQELGNCLKAGLKVYNTEMKYDGWGMKVVHVEGTFNHRPAKLHWHDGNQEFFIETPSGGSIPFEYERS
jgi:hypothetical protein